MDNWAKFLKRSGAKPPAPRNGKSRADRPPRARPVDINALLQGQRRAEEGAKDEPEPAAAPANPAVRYHPTIDRVQAPITKYLAMDCEMVGVGLKDRSALAQVCIVNSDCEIVYLTHVKTVEDVADYRTWVSGVRPEDLRHAPTFQEVQREVHEITDGRIIVGHGLSNDLHALMIKHDPSLIRDTTKYPPFCTLRRGKLRPRRLKHLAEEFLGMEIQTGEHSPAEDAIAPMRLYQLVRKDWEKWLRTKRRDTPPTPTPTPAAVALKARKEEEKEARKRAEAEAKTARGNSHLVLHRATDGVDPFASRKRPRSGGAGGGGGPPSKQARVGSKKERKAVVRTVVEAGAARRTVETLTSAASTFVGSGAKRPEERGCPAAAPRSAAAAELALSRIQGLKKTASKESKKGREKKRRKGARGGEPAKVATV